MRHDIDLLLAALATYDTAGMSPEDCAQVERIRRDLRVARDNAARERVTAELRADGSLVLLTR